MKWFFILSIISILWACSTQTKNVDPNLDAKLDSLRILTQAQDQSKPELPDTLEIDSSALRKEMKKEVKEIEKLLKDSLKEVIVKKEIFDKVFVSKKDKKSKTKEANLAGMEVVYAGYYKKDTSANSVTILATFDELFSGKVQLKAIDKSQKGTELEKKGGKFIKTDKKDLDKASVYIQQQALTFNTFVFVFDEAPSFKDIDYFEISVLK